MFEFNFFLSFASFNIKKYFNFIFRKIEFLLKMTRLKTSLTCSYCSKIFKDPIELPCKHNLCKRHLIEKSVIKQNRIKCVKCKQNFKVRDNDFKLNSLVKTLLDDHVYLSDEEFALKKKIEESIRMFFQMYEQFCLNKTRIDMDVHNHFTEIRFKLDEHRGELKAIIDNIYMEMIEKTKNFEATYLKSLEDKLEASLKSFETTSIEQSLKDTEETFRNQNLLIESIREMQWQQETAMARLKLKMDEQSQVKDHLIKMNEFKPNFSFSQDSFGQLRFNEYSSNDPFESQILKDQQPSELIQLCEFSLKDKWNLLYRGTRDGFGATDFHSKCDNHSNTLTILKAQGTSYIFGGYASVRWDRTSGFKSDPNAFLFSLANKDNRPSKMRQIKTAYSIFCDLFYGPTFGGGTDLCICNSANTTTGSYSYLGGSYQHPQPSQGRSYLAGSAEFQLSEIEVYQKE
jgi:hypothetical protein